MMIDSQMWQSCRDVVTDLVPPTNEPVKENMNELKACIREAIETCGMGDTLMKRIDEIASKFNQTKEILSADEVCAMLSISRSQLYAMVKKEEIVCCKPGGKKRYFERKEIFRWLRTPYQK